MNNHGCVVSEKPSLSSCSAFPAYVENLDGSVCLLIPPGSSQPLADLVLACALPDEPASYCVMVSALIQAGHELVIPQNCRKDVCTCDVCTCQDALPSSIDG